MIDFFDKRVKFLKREKHPLAERALHLYCGDGGQSYRYFCGATGSDYNDWDAFKTWLLNWVLDGRISDTELLQQCVTWFERQHFKNEDEKAVEIITTFWESGGPETFKKQSNFSGVFWLFAAFAEQSVE